MTRLYEFEITNTTHGYRTVVRVPASSEKDARARVPIAPHETASMKIVDEQSAKKPTAPNKNVETKTATPSALKRSSDESALPPHPQKYREPQRPTQSNQSPAPIYYLPELFIWSLTSYAVSEDVLQKRGLRPSLIMPTSVLARRGLVLFYLAAAVASYWIGGEDGRYFDHEAASFSAAINVASWMGIIAVIRYAFFVFPWERSQRLKTQK